MSKMLQLLWTIWEIPTLALSWFLWTPFILLTMGFPAKLFLFRRRHGMLPAVVLEYEEARTITGHAGVAVGNIIVYDRSAVDGLLAHEWGHSIQSGYLGPLYLPVVLLSYLWEILRGRGISESWIEDWADEISRHFSE